MAESSFLVLPKNPILRSLFRLYQKLSAVMNPVWWVLDKRTKTMLDVGCGQGYPMQTLKLMYPVEATGVDLFEGYLKEAKKMGTYKKLINQDIKKLDIKDKSFDTVMCLQVIEHLTKKDALKLIKKMESIARYQVIITTPQGFVQHPETDDNYLQKHLSGWEDKDLEKLGYTVRHQGLKVFFGQHGLVHKPIPRIIKAGIFTLDLLLTPIYFLFPWTSDYWIVAYKKIEK